jgi:hypothetical protein
VLLLLIPFANLFVFLSNCVLILIKLFGFEVLCFDSLFCLLLGCLLHISAVFVIGRMAFE